MSKKKKLNVYKSQCDISPSKGETNSGEVLTIPDDTLSLQQIYDRATLGLNLGVKPKVPSYDGIDDPELFDERIHDTASMTMAEAHELDQELLYKIKNEAELKQSEERSLNNNSDNNNSETSTENN